MVVSIWNWIGDMYQFFGQLYTWLFSPFNLPDWLRVSIAFANPVAYAFLSVGFTPISIITTAGLTLVICLNIKKLILV